ncbi:MAG: hypothetical protein ACKVQV_07825 [Bacteroidia bacterium]
MAATTALDLRQEEANSQETIIAVTAQHAQKRNLHGILSITKEALDQLEEEVILAKERNAHTNVEMIAEKVAHHFQGDAKTDRRAEIAEHLLREAEVILMTVKKDLINEEKRVVIADFQEAEAILMTEKNVHIKEETKKEIQSVDFHEEEVIPAKERKDHLKEETISERVAHHFKEEEVIPMTAKNDHIKEEKKVEKAVRHFQEEEVIPVMERKDHIKEETISERVVHHFQEEEVIPMTAKKDHIKEETRTEKSAHHFQEVAKTEQRAESGERHLHVAEVILMTVKNALLQSGVLSAESAEVESEVRRAESEVFHVTTKLVPIKSVIKADHQVEKIATHVLKRNHLTEIVLPTEKVEVDVAHRVNVVRVQAMI